MDLKREIGLELRRDLNYWPEKKTIEHLLGLFNVWLWEQDARGTPDGGVIWRLERMRINKGVQTPPERMEAKP